VIFPADFCHIDESGDHGQQVGGHFAVSQLVMRCVKDDMGHLVADDIGEGLKWGIEQPTSEKHCDRSVFESLAVKEGHIFGKMKKSLFSVPIGVAALKKPARQQFRTEKIETMTVLIAENVDSNCFIKVANPERHWQSESFFYAQDALGIRLAFKKRAHVTHATGRFDTTKGTGKYPYASDQAFV